jgi:hypothetical protein
VSPIFHLPTPIGTNQFYEHKQTMTKNLTFIHNPTLIPSLCLHTYQIENGDNVHGLVAVWVFLVGCNGLWFSLGLPRKIYSAFIDSRFFFFSP